MITVDVSDAWSEEDLRDLMQASLAYPERTIWAGTEVPISCREELA
jgi:hypothetical protein